MYTLDRRLASHVTVFHQTVDSLIRYALDYTSFLYIPQNVDRFKTTGIDVNIDYTWRPELSLSLGGVWQKAEQTVGEDREYVDAFYVPDLKWRLAANGKMGRVSYGLNLNYTDDRTNMYGVITKVIPDVYELGAHLGVKVTSGLRLNIAGYDLTDEARPDQFGFSWLDKDYPSPGRPFVLSMRYSL